MCHQISLFSLTYYYIAIRCVILNYSLVLVKKRMWKTQKIQTNKMQSELMGPKCGTLHCCRNSSLEEQEAMLELLWALWKDLPQYGRKAAQFVDLIGYFLLVTPQISPQKTKEYLDRTIDLLKEENLKLANHPNSQIYKYASLLIGVNWVYLWQINLSLISAFHFNLISSFFVFYSIWNTVTRWNCNNSVNCWLDKGKLLPLVLYQKPLVRTVGRVIKISTCPTSKTTCLDSRASDQNVHLSYIKNHLSGQ